MSVFSNGEGDATSDAMDDGEVETKANDDASFSVALSKAGREMSQSCGDAAARAKVKGMNNHTGGSKWRNSRLVDG